MTIHIPAQIKFALGQNVPIVISVSGGKDSDAMTYDLIDLVKGEGYSNPLYLIHADLGRAEWRVTGEYVRDQAHRLGLSLAVVQHSKRDLLDGIRHRMETRPDVPPWPSAAARYCTSDWKRGPISKWVRNTFPTGEVIVTMGLRAEESAARAKKPLVERREDCCAKKRTVWNWLPIHHYKLADVWNTIGGRPAHPAYALGNHRLSCALCVLADINDLVNGAESDPELYQAYCDIEIQSGFSFRKGLWLGKLKPELLRPEQREFYKRIA